MKHAAAHSDGSGRLEHLDVIRGWAIFLMVLIHTVRGFLMRDYKFPDSVDMSDSVEVAAVAVRSFLFTTEPYISALFLTVAGFTLVVVGKSSKPWPGRRLRRGLELAILSWVIHWIHAGVNLPYPFLSAEILFTIGLGLVVVSPLVPATRYRWPGLALLSVIIIGFTWFAEGHPDHPLARLAQGPGAHLPNLLFFPIGIGLAAVWQSGKVRWQRAVLATGLLGVIAYHLLIAPGVQAEAAQRGRDVSSVEAIFNRPFGRILTDRRFVVEHRYGSTYDLKWVAHRVGVRDEPPRRFIKRRSYWNKKLVLMPYLAFWMCVTFGFAWLPFWSRLNRGVRGKNPWSVMGRHALLLYLVHLAVIAAAVALVGGNRAGPWGTLVAVLVMVPLCVGVAAGRGWLRRAQSRAR